MTKLSRNEIITLMHLSDGNEHRDIPKGLTPAQYYTALRKLKEQDMVFAAFVEGGAAEAAKIKMAGMAVIDDLAVTRMRIVRKIIKKNELTQDQYELLSSARKQGVSYNDNSFNLSSLGFKNTIFEPLHKRDLVDVASGISTPSAEIIITRLGEQLLDSIEDEITIQLVKESEEDSEVKDIQDRTNHVAKTKIAMENYDSGLYIREDCLAKVISVVHSMNSIGLFCDSNGNKPTIKFVMDTFSKIFHNEQMSSKHYSSHQNTACKNTKNNFLQVFRDMEDNAEKYYDDTIKRQIKK